MPVRAEDEPQDRHGRREERLDGAAQPRAVQPRDEEDRERVDRGGREEKHGDVGVRRRAGERQSAVFPVRVAIQDRFGDDEPGRAEEHGEKRRQDGERAADAAAEPDPFAERAQAEREVPGRGHGEDGERERYDPVGDSAEVVAPLEEQGRLGAARDFRREVFAPEEDVAPPGESPAERKDHPRAGEEQHYAFEAREIRRVALGAEAEENGVAEVHGG